MGWLNKSTGQYYEGDQQFGDVEYPAPDGPGLLPDGVGGWAVDPTKAIPLVQTALQERLDAKARERQYDDIKSACAYASSLPAVAEDNPNFATCEKFRNEGNALQAWMSLTWAMCYSYLASVQAGTNPMPTAGEAVALMPEFTWPD
jgi:hypothetical protein